MPNLFQRTAGIAAAAVVIAAAAMALDDRFGPPPRVLPFKFGAIVVHIPWLLALVVISGAATFLAQRAGASLSGCLLVAVSPALVIGGAVNVLMAVVVTAASIGGHRVHPIDFVGHFIIGWLVLPAIPSLLGSLPFLLSGTGQSTRA
jgi:hypothetical protein